MSQKYEITRASVGYFGVCADKKGGAMVVRWAAKGIGFGELTFYRNGDKGKLTCETECMGKEFIKAVLNKLLETNVKYLDI